MNEKSIIGKSILLREVKYSDAQTILDWRNCPDVGKYFDNSDGKKRTLDDQKKFLDYYYKTESDHYFIAELKKSKAPVGTVAIYNHDPYASKAHWGRVIVDPKFRFFALEMSFLSIRYGFENLKLNKLTGDVQTENSGALKFDYALGFEKEGLLKESHWNGTKNDDVILLAMFKDQYLKLKTRYEKLILKQ